MKCPYTTNRLQCIHIDTAAMTQLVPCDECVVRKQIHPQPREIVIDFDGTVVVHEFPKVGRDIGAVPVLKKLIDRGHRLILFTMRSDSREKYLTDAIQWFEQNQIPLYGIQTNPTQKTWTSSPKAHGDVYIDDRALGVPLKLDTRTQTMCVDWVEVEKWLVKNDYL